MSDPEKLFDRGDDFERSLLAAAVDEQEEREREARTLLALGLGGPVGPPPVPDGSGGGFFGSALGKGIGVAALGGIVIAAAIALQKPPTLAPAPALSVPIASTKVTSASEPEPPAPPSAAADDPPSPPAPSARRGGMRAAPSAAPATDSSALKREIAALDRVRAALKTGDAKAARAELDRYDREFPFGSLGPEAKALRTRLNKLPSSEKK